MRWWPVWVGLAAGCAAVDEPKEKSGGPWAAPCPSEEAIFRDVDVGEVTLNVACRGEAGSTIVLLHGFPEFWFGWNAVMDELADGYRLVVPDQRGYNLSDKPAEVADYALEHLVADVVGLVDAIGSDTVTLVGHDWGGAVAWAVASQHPDLLDRLVILNAPHMDVFRDLLLNDEEQQAAFSYVDLFLLEGSEDLMAANDYAAMVDSMGGVLSESEVDAYKEAWAQPGAMTGGLNWYRANFEADGIPKAADPLTVDVPTTVVWGMDDIALLPKNLDDLPTYVSDLTVIEIDEGTHWVAHEFPAEVAAAIDGAAR
jgi:epoxide hydrolase 4